ncbi:MAG: dephospho-CoA kinase [Pirellula sp.]|jgi:dephospho-CoA kinase|nr:dephospho-CoA kinase [Pirellula sp.]
MEQQKQKRIVGIIGGIASGKSLVTDMLHDLGAAIVNADKVAHDVLEEPAVVEKIREAFGDEVILPPPIGHEELDRVNRAKVAALVFGESELHQSRRRQLEEIVQPRIRQRLEEHIDRWQTQSQSGMLALDIPLLYERGWDRRCDEVWFVDTPQSLREQNAARRNWTPEELENREKSQMSIEKKRELADRILANDGSIEDLRSRVRSAFDAAMGHPR